MTRYIPCGCNKCDFHRNKKPKACEYGRCNIYKESYIKTDTDCEIGCATLHDFNEQYGTDWEE